MNEISKIFGSMVFNESVMLEKLPKDTYKALKKTIAEGRHLNGEVANIVAAVMKDWALERGATHYTHWFQPMTGITAEKHDAFISPAVNGKVIMEFSGKELVRGEPDASSFPSGGLRATFEARGYTAWDPTSYAFIKDRTLCIPTAFCSYSGEALDKKTPLLRSMQVLNTQAMRILKLFGNTEAKRVNATAGAEQEYFLIDKDVYLKRPDLKFCGRTLFGARPPKGQEMGDHYFGSIKARVSAFMKELDEELWRLGVLAKTEHNEAAPAQHELAPIFSTVNIATDGNQLTMELMKSVALRHNLVCLLHEKPFAGVNGSGKHNNWSLSTDTGVNLLEPGETPELNAQFLLFLTAVIKAVDDYQDLLRVSVSSAGNDHRLGAGEAPPAIVSVFLGDELTAILEAIESNAAYNGKKKSKLEVGVTALPDFNRDTTDRNRTSPFAFTGNKFEFRMPGSSCSISGPNFVLNTIVAEVLEGFADILEAAPDFTKGLNELIRGAIAKHKRIIFNGNNYSAEWVTEAEKRGLMNLKTTPEALPSYINGKNIAVLTKHRVLAESEIRSRYEVKLDSYIKTVRIDGLTLSGMLKKDILPAVFSYQAELCEAADLKAGKNASCVPELKLLQKISVLAETLYNQAETLDAALNKEKPKNALDAAVFSRDTILKEIFAIRKTLDELEPLIAKKHWCYPTYEEILFSVN